LPSGEPSEPELEIAEEAVVAPGNIALPKPLRKEGESGVGTFKEDDIDRVSTSSSFIEFKTDPINPSLSLSESSFPLGT